MYIWVSSTNANISIGAVKIATYVLQLTIIGLCSLYERFYFSLLPELKPMTFWPPSSSYQLGEYTQSYCSTRTVVKQGRAHAPTKTHPNSCSFDAR